MAVMKKRAEIAPLHGRSILELVKKEMVETHSDLLVYEWSIRTVYDTLKNSVGIINAQHILLLHEFSEGIG